MDRAKLSPDMPDSSIEPWKSCKFTCSRGQPLGFPGGSTVKNPSAMQETWVRSLGWEDPLEENMQPTPVFLPGESPWTEEPGGLQSTGLKRVGHDWATKHSAQGQASDVSVAGKLTGTLTSWNTQRTAANGCNPGMQVQCYPRARFFSKES